MKKYCILFLLFSLPLSAALITGVQVASYTSQIGSPYFRPAYASIDGSGLNAATGTHTTGPEVYMWLSAAGDLAPKIVYDLGNYYNLESIRIWNYNEPDKYLNRGARNVEILVSANNINFTSMTNTIFNKAPGSASVDFSQTISLLATDIRYVKLNITSNYGDANYTGLSEVQFYGSVPEASTGILFCISLLLSCCFLKK